MVRAEIAIDVTAAPRVGFDLAADIARWPASPPHYRYVTVRSLDERPMATRLVDRLFVRPIALRELATFKRLAEASE